MVRYFALVLTDLNDLNVVDLIMHISLSVLSDEVKSFISDFQTPECSWNTMTYVVHAGGEPRDGFVCQVDLSVGMESWSICQAGW